MTQLNEERPMAMLQVVWRQYRAIAFTARQMKSSQESARKKTLLLAFSGAFLSTLAGVLAGTAGSERVGELLEQSAAWLAVLAAVAIALASYLGRELLSSAREDEWLRCRALAEAIKQDIFKALVRVAPYGESNATEVLRERVTTLLQNSGLSLRGAALENTADKPLPAVRTVDDYIKERVEDQITHFYRPRASTHQKDLERYRAWTLGLGAAAAVMSIVGAKAHPVALWVPVVTTAGAALTTFIQASRIQGLIPLYQQTASQLELSLASWKDRTAVRGNLTAEAVRAETSDFVIRCEDIMSRESDAWRAEWKSDEGKSSVGDFLTQVEAAAHSKEAPATS